MCAANSNMNVPASFANILLLISCVLAGLVLLVALIYAYIYYCKQTHHRRSKNTHAMDSLSGAAGGGDTQVKQSRSFMILTMKKKAAK